MPGYVTCTIKHRNRGMPLYKMLTPGIVRCRQASGGRLAARESALAARCRAAATAAPWSARAWRCGSAEPRCTWRASSPASASGSPSSAGSGAATGAAAAPPSTHSQALF